MDEDIDYEDPDHQLGRVCCMRGCGATLHDLSPIEVCRPCGMKIARTFRTELALEDRKPLAVAQQTRRAAPAPSTSVVYYARVTGGIKIGYTAYLPARMKQLRVDAESLLAVEPGGRARERERHIQFAMLRRSPRVEDFNESPELLAHIETLRSQHPIPPECRPAHKVRAVRRWPGT